MKPLITIERKMTDDHHRCDTLFAEAEAQVCDGRWDAAEGGFRQFADAMDRHLRMEEEVLFPRFEAATGMTPGPTEIMRQEHTQMRDLLAGMERAINRRDGDDYLGLSETLLIVMQQHNVKEEQVLYPMADQSIGDGVPRLIEAMDAV